MTSALWYPKDIKLLAGYFPSHIENIDIKNPDKSLNKCAASLKIANEFARTPPVI